MEKTCKYLDLSTSHMRKETDELLRSWFLESINRDTGDVKDDHKNAITSIRHVSSHHYGHIFFLGEYAPNCDEAPELKGVFELALKLDCSMVNFDADAPVLENLPTFEW